VLTTGTNSSRAESIKEEHMSRRSLRTLAGAAVGLTALGVGAAGALAGNDSTGNGAPSGSHYQFNIIGVEKGKTADMSGDNGRRMFVPLWGQAKILLTEGEFNVIDANGTDGSASFSLPNPDPDGDGTTDYSVYVRALGKPGGKATMQSCYEDTTGYWCAVDFDGGVNPVTVERTKGRQTFSNVSKDLLYVDYCVTWDTDTGECTEVDQIPLFSDDALEYYWQYDNQGLRIAQLRFYEVPTDTPW
jgi:hypothetical protein